MDAAGVAPAFTALCAAALVALLIVEKTRRLRLKIAVKAIASACFLVVALAGSSAPVDRVEAGLLVGLGLGAAGDVALAFRGKRAFLWGLVAFLLGHVAYAVAFSRLAPPPRWDPWSALVVAACGAGTLRWLWPRLGSMRVPVVVYVAVICTMVVAALAVLGTPSAARALIAIGAAAFAVSDLAVARERFVRDSFVNKAWGLPAYYAGQLCLAWALHEL